MRSDPVRNIFFVVSRSSRTRSFISNSSLLIFHLLITTRTISRHAGNAAPHRVDAVHRSGSGCQTPVRSRLVDSNAACRDNYAECSVPLTESLTERDCFHRGYPCGVFQFRHPPFKGNKGKSGAATERTTAYAGYAGWYGNTRKASAAEERIPTDAGYTVWYGNIRQVYAVIERFNADAGYAVGYGNTRQVPAVGERIIADGNYGVRYGNTRQVVGAVIERILIDAIYGGFGQDKRHDLSQSAKPGGSGITRAAGDKCAVAWPYATWKVEGY